MIFRRSPLRLININKVLIGIGIIVVVVSCGDPQYHAPPIVVTFDPNFSPPASLETGAYAGIAAVVTNGNNNNSVSFTCTPAGQCGTFTPSGSSSGVPVCYLAPAQVPAGNTVTVTATSGADATKSVSAMITIVNGAPNPCP
jgi:hypothetical protein